MYNLTDSATGGNQVFGKAGITGLSGAATTFSTANPTGGSGLMFSVRGISYYKADFSSAATPTNDASTWDIAASPAIEATAATGSAFRPQLANTVCCYVFGVDKSGNARVAQGPIVAWTDTSANSTIVQYPSLPDWITPFAYAVIKGGATTTSWTFGTNNWNATGVVIDTAVNVSLLPGTPPQTA
jgi:hypothetical protein